MRTQTFSEIADPKGSIKEPQFMPPGLALADSLRREGKYEEARRQIALELASSGGDLTLRLACAVQQAKVERSAGRLALALKVLLEAARLADECADEDLRARYHHGLGVTYHRLSETDLALVEYAAASYHWSCAGHVYDAGCVENNIALIKSVAGRGVEAHDAIARARLYFTGMDVKLAEVDESEAQIYLAEEDPDEALRLVTQAVGVFILYGETELKLKALPTLIKAAADCQAKGEASAR